MPEEERWFELRRRFDESPYARLLGMKVVAIGKGHASVKLTVRDDFANFAGLTHGGLLMSLADHAFGCALNTLDRTYVALQFNINIVGRAVPGEDLTAEGRILHAGRRAGHGEMRVFDQAGKLVAVATGSVVALER